MNVNKFFGVLFIGTPVCAVYLPSVELATEASARRQRREERKEREEKNIRHKKKNYMFINKFNSDNPA